MERLGLHVLSGLHAGALIDLGGKPGWMLGAGEDADILLADDGLAELQCRFVFDPEEESWQLESCAEGVTVFGLALPSEGAVHVRAGTSLSVQGVDMALVQLQEAMMPDRPAMILATSARRLASAHRAVLWQLDRKAYAFAVMRAGRQLRYLPLVVLVLLAVVGGTKYQIDHYNADKEPAREAHDYIRRTFPDINVAYEKSTGATTYAGYVTGQRDLDYLRTLAMAADQGQSVIHVVPMESLAMNASLLLDEYYRDPLVSVTGPGAVHVALSADSAVKGLGGWDFSAISALVRHELPELRDVNIAMAKARANQVDVPYSVLDYSVLPTRDDAYFAISPNGERLFPGASVKEGKLARVGPCGVALASGSALFQFSADKTLSCAYEIAHSHGAEASVSTTP
ncbi:hypothetical protein [Dyella mobilis]|uniref:YscD cytoplasmic domain-containing protein n=1 Tax=Dyella mobilis TaxID=1849582 RepID=A0ABS2KDT2_9GAMM|nr:hypothetical protein [Dyella mobilis]MBM7128498.1 hypothetical protein [Dyella mobilis]